MTWYVNRVRTITHVLFIKTGLWRPLPFDNIHTQLRVPFHRYWHRIHDMSNTISFLLQSFVQNVTARVTGFLPATITKWFSSPTTTTSSGNSNGSTTAGYTTDSSSDDETSDRTSTSTHPPVKRMRFSTNISPVPASAHILSQVIFYCIPIYFSRFYTYYFFNANWKMIS